MDPVTIALQKRNLGKKSELARELRREVAAFGAIEQRSLEAYLGKLQRGDRGWWQSRPKLQKAFAKHVDLELSDLGFLPRPSNESHAFPGFPALRPLDLAKESPAAIHHDVPLWRNSDFDASFWLDPAACRGPQDPRAGVYWLQIPRGCGLDLLWEQLIAQGRTHCADAEVLDRYSLSLTGARPLILRIAQPVDLAKLEAVGTLDLRSAVLVLSRHAPPPPAENSSPLFTFQAIRELATHLNSPFQGGMRRELTDTWREQLLEWILDRTKGLDTLLSREDLDRWIGNLLPWRSAVTSPRELIVICGLLHRLDRRKTDRFLIEGGGEAFLKACLDNRVHADRLGKALRNRYSKGSGSWREPLLPEDWTTHLDAGISRPPNINASIAAVIDGKTVKQRREAAASLLSEWSRTNLVEMMGEFGLAEQNDGRYQVQLELVADLMAADMVSILVDECQVAHWARFYLDPSRRQGVEISLWRRSVPDLVRDVEHVLSQAEEPIYQLAAEEALFWTLGLKLAQPGIRLPAPNMPALQSLFDRIFVRRRLADFNLWTRDLRAPDEALTWLTVCWAWSLHVEKPERMGDLVIEVPWLFPCWAMPGDLHSCLATSLPLATAQSADFIGRGAGRGAWSIWWPVAQGVLDQLDTAPLAPPKGLMPALLLWALRGERQIEPDWLIVTSQITSDLVQRHFGLLEAHDKERLLDALLDALKPDLLQNRSEAQYETTLALSGAVEADRLATSWLSREALQGLESEAVIRIARPERFGLLFQCLGHWSNTVLAALAEAVPVQPAWEKVFLQVLPFMPPGSWQTAAAWIGSSPSGELAAWLWREDPQATVRLLTNTGRLSEMASFHLIENVPEDYVSAVADFLAASDSLVSRLGRAEWAAQRLPLHGTELSTLIKAIALSGWG